MAFSEGLQTISGTAAADLSARQYRCLKMNSSEQYAVAGDAGEVDGISQNDPDAQGKAVTVGIAGISKLEAGGTVVPENYISSDSVGRGVAGVSGEYIVGRAITGGTVGSIISVAILKQRRRL